MAIQISSRLFLLTLAIVEANYYRDAEAKNDPCEFGHLPCDNGQCIPRQGWCDENVDCSDESDESYCQLKTPDNKPEDVLNECRKSLHFRCEVGVCIPKAARCDDLPDCSGGDDEENCDYYYQWSEDDNARKGSTTPIITVTSTTTAETTTRTTTITPIIATTLTSIPKYLTKWTASNAMEPTSLLPSSGEAVKKGLRFLLDLRDSQWGWGKSTAKMTIALHLGNNTYFDPGNMDAQLSKKQLEVQLAIDLMRKHDQPIPLPELSHYIHSLLVVCDNPRDFHGVNIVKLLKHEMHGRRERHLFVSPLAYLALCNAGDANDSHIRRIKNMAYRRTEQQRWLDVQAYALLAIVCYSRSNGSSKEWKVLKEDVAKSLSDWQQDDGSFGSVYSTGLALQALIAAEEPDTETAKGRAMTYLKLKQNWEGSFGSDLDTFYVLPALNLNSMAVIGERQCKSVPSSTLSTEAVGEKKRKKKKWSHVHFSLWIGDEKQEIHTITLTLAPHSNFLEVMEAAQKANPKYKFVIWMGKRGPVVDSIAGRSANVEKSVYWTLYRKVPLPFRPTISNTTVTSSRLRLLGATKYIKDIRKLYPKDGEHLAFWLKSYA